MLKKPNGEANGGGLNADPSQVLGHLAFSI
jgi:hypothetical protein